MFALILVVLVFSLGACSIDDPNKADEKPTYATKTVKNVDMKIKNVKRTEDGKGRHDMLRVNMKVTNHSNSKFGIGGGDFILKDKKAKKEYHVEPTANNIGTEVAVDKSAEGSVIFSIDKDASKKLELVYKPVVVKNSKTKAKELSKWTLTLPQKSE